MPATATALVRGTLDMLILRALRWEPTHGAGVAEWMRLVTNGTLQVEEGTLYPALRRLEQRGMIESEWATSERHRRARYYQLTPQGRQWFWTELDKWERYVDTMNRVLRYGSAGSIRGR
jgi:transcriptional regulator